jgi:hypothetical protein
MHKLLTRSGFTLVAVGSVLLSPLADLLPVDLMPYPTGQSIRPESHQYVRVIPSGRTDLDFLAVGLLVAGAVTLVIGWLFRRRKKPH